MGGGRTASGGAAGRPASMSSMYGARASSSISVNGSPAPTTASDVPRASSRPPLIVSRSASSACRISSARDAAPRGTHTHGMGAIR
jgi:hypothetical protein